MKDRPVIKDLADATGITERQKMAIWLTCQIAVGNMSKEEALEHAKQFDQYMNGPQ